VTDVVLIGGGGHARVIAGMVRELPDLHLVGYTAPEAGGVLDGAEYLGPDSALIAWRARRDGRPVALALGIGHVGDPEPRRAVARRMEEAGFSFQSVVSRSASVAPSAELGRGTVVMPGAVVNAGALVGVFAIVNSNAVVEHGCSVGEHAHVGPGAILCGDVRIGDRSMVGAGAVVVQGLDIAAGCVIGAGAVVTCALTEPGVYVGCPARRRHP
jgi:UDP-perosamine 4-acetyltransferase